MPARKAFSLQAHQSVAEGTAMTPARPIVPGQTVMITARAVGRTYRFRPKPRVVALLQYCLAAALLGFRIDVHEFCWMSNHWHVVLTDHDGELSEFVRKLHSLISRGLNAIRGTKGSNFEKGFTLQVETDEEAILRHCAYALANPVRANLVSGMRHWKGAHSGRLRYGQVVTVNKPKSGLWRAPSGGSSKTRKREVDPTRASFRGVSKLPDTVAFTLVRPPVLAGTHSDQEVREEVWARVARIEKEVGELRRATSKRPLGMAAAASVDWWDLPRGRDELFGRRPKVAGSTRKARLRYLRWYRDFQRAYRQARDSWCDGERDVVFPFGTYLMRKRFAVCCAPAPG